MRSRLGLARASAAVVGVSAVALTMTALPASADQVRGTLDGGTDGYQINLAGTDNQPVTNLFKLDVGDKALRVYCVELNTTIESTLAEQENREQRDMVERSWDAYPDEGSPFHKNRAKINWVLHHGYPALQLDAIEKELGGDVKLNKQEAITATQAAAWHFSDGVDLNKQDPLPHENDATDKDVLALYKYLTGEQNTGIDEQPSPALKVSPKEASGKAGERIGPFTVATNGDITNFTSEFPKGVTFTDADGGKLDIDNITDGTQFYVDVPEGAGEGWAKFTLTAASALDTGRLFVVDGYAKKPAQSLIVASSDEVTVDMEGKATWTAAPVETTTPETTAPSTTSEVAAPPSSEQPSVTPKANSEDLAYTGASVLTPLLIGAGLLAVGMLALVLVRRKRA